MIKKWAKRSAEVNLVSVISITCYISRGSIHVPWKFKSKSTLNKIYIPEFIQKHVKKQKNIVTTNAVAQRLLCISLFSTQDGFKVQYFISPL